MRKGLTITKRVFSLLLCIMLLSSMGIVALGSSQEAEETQLVTSEQGITAEPEAETELEDSAEGGHELVLDGAYNSASVVYWAYSGSTDGIASVTLGGSAVPGTTVNGNIITLGTGLGINAFYATSDSAALSITTKPGYYVKSIVLKCGGINTTSKNDMSECRASSSFSYTNAGTSGVGTATTYTVTKSQFSHTQSAPNYVFLITTEKVATYTVTYALKAGSISPSSLSLPTDSNTYAVSDTVTVDSSYGSIVYGTDNCYYTFDGWYSYNGATYTKVGATMTGLTENVTLYGEWTKHDVGALTIAKSVVDEYDKEAAGASYTIVLRTWSGTYSKPTDAPTPAVIDNVTSTDIVLTAVPDEYYDYDSYSVTLKDGQSVTFSYIPVGTHYSVSEIVSDSDKYVDTYAGAGGDIVLGANAATVTNTYPAYAVVYALTADSENPAEAGSLPTTVYYQSGDAVTLNTEYGDEYIYDEDNNCCYIFNGWYADSALTALATDFNMGTNGVTLYGEWTKLECTKLTVTKAVDDASKRSDAEEDYSFVLKLWPVDGAAYDGEAVNVTVDDGFVDPSATDMGPGGFYLETPLAFTLKGDESVTFLYVPEGYNYKLEEIVPTDAAYTASYAGGATGTTGSEDIDITVTNIYDPYNVSYELNNYSDAAPAGYTELPTDASAYEAGQSVDVKDYCDGVVYDSANSCYYIFYGWYDKAGTQITDSFNMPADDVTLYGYWIKTECGSVSVTKNVVDDSKTVSADTEYTFRLTVSMMEPVPLDGANETESTYAEPVTFTLKAGQTKTFEYIPLGCSYEITEVVADNAEYVAAYSDNASGMLTDAGKVSVTVTNTYDITAPTSTPKASPKTGDGNMPALWALLLGASVMSLGAVTVVIKKKSGSK